MTTVSKQQSKSDRTHRGSTYENARTFNLNDANEKTARALKQKQLEEWLRDADQVWEDSPDRKHFENGPFEVEYAVENVKPGHVRIYWTISVVDDEDNEEDTGDDE